MSADRRSKPLRVVLRLYPYFYEALYLVLKCQTRDTIKKNVIDCTVTEMVVLELWLQKSKRIRANMLHPARDRIRPLSLKYVEARALMTALATHDDHRIVHIHGLLHQAIVNQTPHIY